MTWRSKLGLTEISPVNGSLWEAIKTTQDAIPIAKSSMAIAAVRRLSLWTRATVTRMRPPSKRTTVHLTQLIFARLMTRRSLRASRALRNAEIISRCAVACASPREATERMTSRASISTALIVGSEVCCRAIAVDQRGDDGDSREDDNAHPNDWK